jgi:hypothetical protein
MTWLRWPLALVVVLVSATVAFSQAEAEADIDVDEMTAAELPQPLRALHTCAKPDDPVRITQAGFGRRYLFAITCPRAAPGFARHQPDTRDDNSPEDVRRWAHYLARDAEGRGAIKLTFPILRRDGRIAVVDTLSSGGRPERTRPYAADGPPVRRPDYNPPRYYADFSPPGGPCMVRVLWAFSGQKPRLIYWAEAEQCPAHAPPVMKAKLDRLPPGTVLRVNDGIPNPAR